MLRAFPDPILSRRRVLALALLGPALGAATVGCGHSGPPAPDPLEDQLKAARRDSEMAAAAAKAAPPPAVPALTVIAAERSRHAAALLEEMSRAAGTAIPTETASPSASATPAAAPVRPPSVDDVAKSLRESADGAAKLAPTPTPDPDRPKAADQAALFDAVAAEHAAIYGYGLVSARVMPEQNDLVSQTLAQHRDRREAAIAMLKERSITIPLPAAGYQLPFPVTGPIGAAKLAIRMESDCAVAWRAVMEQSDSEQDRAFALTALTQSALMATRWRQVLGAWPVTEAFPGGTE